MSLYTLAFSILFTVGLSPLTQASTTILEKGVPVTQLFLSHSADAVVYLSETGQPIRTDAHAVSVDGARRNCLTCDLAPQRWSQGMVESEGKIVTTWFADPNYETRQGYAQDLFDNGTRVSLAPGLWQNVTWLPGGKAWLLDDLDLVSLQSFLPGTLPQSLGRAARDLSSAGNRFYPFTGLPYASIDATHFVFSRPNPTVYSPELVVVDVANPSQPFSLVKAAKPSLALHGVWNGRVYYSRVSNQGPAPALSGGSDPAVADTLESINPDGSQPLLLVSCPNLSVPRIDAKWAYYTCDSPNQTTSLKAVSLGTTPSTVVLADGVNPSNLSFRFPSPSTFEGGSLVAAQSVLPTNFPVTYRKDPQVPFPGFWQDEKGNLSTFDPDSGTVSFLGQVDPSTSLRDLFSSQIQASQDKKAWLFAYPSATDPTQAESYYVDLVGKRVHALQPPGVKSGSVVQFALGTAGQSVFFTSNVAGKLTVGRFDAIDFHTELIALDGFNAMTSLVPISDTQAYVALTTAQAGGIYLATFPTLSLTKMVSLPAGLDALPKDSKALDALKGLVAFYGTQEGTTPGGYSSLYIVETNAPPVALRLLPSPEDNGPPPPPAPLGGPSGDIQYLEFDPAGSRVYYIDDKNVLMRWDAP